MSYLTSITVLSNMMLLPAVFDCNRFISFLFFLFSSFNRKIRNSSKVCGSVWRRGNFRRRWWYWIYSPNQIDFNKKSWYCSRSWDSLFWFLSSYTKNFIIYKTEDGRFLLFTFSSLFREPANICHFDSHLHNKL